MRKAARKAALARQVTVSQAAWPPIPRIWEGQTVAIAASGPSMTRQQLDAVRGRARLVVVNTTWRLAPWADMLYAADVLWWQAEPGLDQFDGLRVGTDKESGKMPAGVIHIPGDKLPGMSSDPNRIHWGNNSGYQALNIAYLAGACRILLLGFDMRRVGGRLHWHEDHPRGLKNPDANLLREWCENFKAAARDLAAAGVDVINCTPGSALTCFRHGTLAESL